MSDVAYSPSGRHIASSSLDGDVKLWSAFNGTQVNLTIYVVYTSNI
jgi:telomerase protein component 1